jgi:hypothetical protein
MPPHFGGTFAFLPTLNAKLKMQKSHQANTQEHYKMTQQRTTEEEERTANRVDGLANVD